MSNPKCRFCHREIDKVHTREGADWIMPSRNWYYHTNCYNNWVSKKNDLQAVADDDEWEDLLWDYLRRDAHVPNLNFQKFDSQWHNFLMQKSPKMTAKGIFFSAKYFYDIQHGNAKDAAGGIGIIPYIYLESCNFWQDRADNAGERYAQLEKQLADQNNRPIQQATPRLVKPKQPQYNLSDIMAMEDDE